MAKTAVFGGGNKTSTWPKVSFLAVRIVQLILAIVPAAVSGFFVVALREANYNIPWQFSVIFIAGCLTIVNSIITGIAVFFRLSSVLVLIVDWICLVLWIVSWGSLAQALKKNVVVTCSTENWGNSNGVKVCSFYKVAFAFCIVSTLAMAITILIATSVRQHRGEAQYAPMNSNPQLRSENDFELQPSDIHNTQTSFASTAYTDDGLKKPAPSSQGYYSDEPAPTRQPSVQNRNSYYSNSQRTSMYGQPNPHPLPALPQDPRAAVQINLDDSADTAYDSYRPETAQQSQQSIPSQLQTRQPQAPAGQDQSPTSVYSPYPDSAGTSRYASYDDNPGSTPYGGNNSKVAASGNNYSAYTSTQQPTTTYTSYSSTNAPLHSDRDGDLSAVKTDYAAYSSYSR